MRDKGPDYRGFVQLPVLQPSATDSVTALIIEATALCFVDTCQRTFNTNVLKCHVSFGFNEYQFILKNNVSLFNILTTGLTFMQTG